MATDHFTRSNVVYNVHQNKEKESGSEVTPLAVKISNPVFVCTKDFWVPMIKGCNSIKQKSFDRDQI